MSRGIGGDAILACEDGKSALYSYRTYNWNIGQDDELFDGLIYIERAPIDAARRCLVSRSHPEGILDPNWRDNVDMLDMLESGALSIENCSSCWKLVGNGIDGEALTLVYHMMEFVMCNEAFPPKFSYLK